LAMEAEPVGHPVVRRPPPHRDRPGLRVAGLAEAVDDLRVAARSRRVVHMLVPPTEPRPVERDDQRQHDRDHYRAAEEPELSPSPRTLPHEPPPPNPGEVGEFSEPSERAVDRTSPRRGIRAAGEDHSTPTGAARQTFVMFGAKSRLASS